MRLGAASIALLALLGVGHVLPAFHFALVAHRVCAEHGELVHDSAPAAEPSSPTNDVSWVAGARLLHEHEHCGVLALPGSVAVPPPPTAWMELTPNGSEGAPLGRARVAHVGVELLSYAPKLAPPS